jgi:hypothetical protein
MTDNMISPLPARLERLRARLLRAMSFVATTEHALDPDELLSERQVLDEAWKVINQVVSELNDISVCNGPAEDKGREQS